VTAPVSIVAAVLGLFWSAQARVTGTVLGQAFSIPVLGIVAVVVTLVLLATILFAVRALVRDGLRLRPRMAGT